MVRKSLRLQGLNLWTICSLARCIKETTTVLCCGKHCGKLVGIYDVRVGISLVLPQLGSKLLFYVCIKSVEYHSKYFTPPGTILTF